MSGVASASLRAVWQDLVTTEQQALVEHLLE